MIIRHLQVLGSTSAPTTTSIAETRPTRATPLASPALGDALTRALVEAGGHEAGQDARKDRATARKLEVLGALLSMCAAGCEAAGARPFHVADPTPSTCSMTSFPRGTGALVGAGAVEALLRMLQTIGDDASGWTRRCRRFISAIHLGDSSRRFISAICLGASSRRSVSAICLGDLSRRSVSAT